MSTPAPPTPPSPADPAAPVPPHQRVSKRGIVDDPAPNAFTGKKPTGYENRTDPVWPGHPAWCGCNNCENGTPPPELAQTKVEIDREVVGTREHIYWSDGSVTWRRVPDGG